MQYCSARNMTWPKSPADLRHVQLFNFLSHTLWKSSARIPALVLPALLSTHTSRETKAAAHPRCRALLFTVLFTQNRRAMRISWEGLFCSCRYGCRGQNAPHKACARAAAHNLKLLVQTLSALCVGRGRSHPQPLVHEHVLSRSKCS